MNEIKLTRDELGEAFDSFKEGDTADVCATITVTSVSGDELTATVDSVAPDVEGGDQEFEVEGEDEDEPAPAKSKSAGKGMGILITVAPAGRN